MHFFLDFILKIYLLIYFWLYWTFFAAPRLSVVAASGGYSLDHTYLHKQKHVRHPGWSLHADESVGDTGFLVIGYASFLYFLA